MQPIDLQWIWPKYLSIIMTQLKLALRLFFVGTAEIVMNIKLFIDIYEKNLNVYKHTRV